MVFFKSLVLLVLFLVKIKTRAIYYGQSTLRTILVPPPITSNNNYYHHQQHFRRNKPNNEFAYPTVPYFITNYKQFNQESKIKISNYQPPTQIHLSQVTEKDYDEFNAEITTASNKKYNVAVPVKENVTLSDKAFTKFHYSEKYVPSTLLPLLLRFLITSNPVFLHHVINSSPPVLYKGLASTEYVPRYAHNFPSLGIYGYSAMDSVKDSQSFGVSSKIENKI